LLEADGFRPSAALLALAALLLGAWLVWFFRSEVPVYEVTSNARLETNRAAYVVQSPIAGKLLASSLTVGREVQAGEELARVESDRERLERSEQSTRISSTGAQIATLRSQIVLSQKAGEEEQQATRAAIDVAQSQLKSAEAPAQFAEKELERLRKLRESQLIAEREYQKGVSDAQSLRATVDSLRLTIARLDREQKLRESERRVKEQQMRTDISRLEGDIAGARSTVQRLEYEIGLRIIRAPVAGRIGEAAVLRPGAYLEEGQRLGAVVPAGGIVMVAQYPPAAAIGRIQPGQQARIRLQGFPWTQYGTLPGTVDRVAGEVRDGTVRVELSVHPSAASPVALQHGLPGNVEIAVERVSPAVLAFRMAGVMATAPRAGRGASDAESTPAPAPRPAATPPDSR
jgi:multidrug resistance efflux pump